MPAYRKKSSQKKASPKYSHRLKKISQQREERKEPTRYLKKPQLVTIPVKSLPNELIGKLMKSGLYPNAFGNYILSENYWREIGVNVPLSKKMKKSKKPSPTLKSVARQYKKFVSPRKIQMEPGQFSREEYHYLKELPVEEQLEELKDIPLLKAKYILESRKRQKRAQEEEKEKEEYYRQLEEDEERIKERTKKVTDINKELSQLISGLREKIEDEDVFMSSDDSDVEMTSESLQMQEGLEKLEEEDKVSELTSDVQRVNTELDTLLARLKRQASDEPEPEPVPKRTIVEMINEVSDKEDDTASQVSEKEDDTASQTSEQQDEDTVAE